MTLLFQDVGIQLGFFHAGKNYLLYALILILQKVPEVGYCKDLWDHIQVYLVYKAGNRERFSGSIAWAYMDFRVCGFIKQV